MPLSRLFARAAPYRWPLLAAAALALLASGATLALPWLAGQLLGDVLGGGAGAAGAVGALLALALAATTFLTIACTMVSAKVAGRVLADLRCEAYAHVQALPLAFHDASRRGDLLALMTFEVSSLSQFLTASLAQVPALLLTAGGAIVLLLWIDPLVGLVVPVLAPIVALALRLAGRRLRELAARARDADAQLVTSAEEDLAMLPATKAFATEAAHLAHYRQLAENAFRLGLAQTRISALLGPLVALVAGLGVIGVLLLAGRGEGAAAQSPAALVSLLLYAALLTRPIGALAEFYGRLQWARGTLARLEAVLAQPPEPGYAAGLPLARAKGCIAFEGISFAYPGRPPLLDRLSLDIAAGEVVALTGDNGAGKSTLIHLLMGFYHPDAGRITLDGQDIAQLQVQHLRRQFGLVPQRALLANASLRRNLTLGHADAGEDAIAAALALAQADGFVAALPHGLDTVIGDDGVRLSGGQRQRLALARALLPDPPVLIFDEATAMVDHASEAAFVAACQTALVGRTVLIVTHRPASLALAHRIIRIEGGKAVASG